MFAWHPNCHQKRWYLSHQLPFEEFKSCFISKDKYIYWTFYQNFAQEINGNASFVKLLPTVQEACWQTQNELTFPHHQHDQMDGRNPARSYLHRPHNLLLPHHRCSHMDTFGRPCLCNVRNQSITWQKSLQPYTNTFLFHLYKKIYKWMLKQVRYWENVTAVTLTSPASSA